MTKLNAKQLRISQPSESDLKKIKRNPIYLVLDEVLDTYNIGSMFRLADAVAMEKVYLCGNMEYPPSVKIHRSAVGTENWTPWEKRDSALKVIRELKSKSHPELISGSKIPKQLRNDSGVQIIAIEQHPLSTSYQLLKPKFPCAIIAGHETKGISKEVLKEADVIVELPMLGINKSFNVWGTTAVVAYKILEHLK
jgi:tRNA G18 (ribose-2'-O)-methylase SpoU